MRIDQKSPPSAVTSTTSARRVGAGGERFMPASAARAGSAGAPAPLASLDAILMLQGEGDAGERRRRAARRGNDILDTLDGLKAALLAGRVPAEQLSTLAARLSERRDASGDERLDDIIAHIELRAQVEIAKLRTRS